MTVITARGADSSEAMDEVIRRLGVNAYILSTSFKDGLVEIRASTELPEKEPSRLDARLDSAGEIRLDREGETMAERAQRFADLLEARSDWADPPPLRPAVPPRRTPWARVSPSARHAALVDRLEAELLAPDPLEVGHLRPRTIIVGAPGAGKSLLAVRLAAAAMLHDRWVVPRLIAPRMAALLSEDRLRGWSRLLGLTPERPLIGDMLQSEAVADAQSPQIIDLSDIAGATPDLAAALMQAMPTEIILAMPSGLSARRTLREGKVWAALSPRVCLTFADLAGPDAAQLRAMTEAGLRLSRAATGTGLIDTLSVPVRADLARWVQEEADEADDEKAETRT